MNDMPEIGDFLNEARTRHPIAWNKCLHAGDDGSWIRLVARDLNATDGRFGLNAKRDGSSGDISKDCIAWYVGPTDRHVQVYDVIGRHELPDASIIRLDQTNYSTIGNHGTARFVHPVTGGGFVGSEPNPVPGTPMYSVNEALNYLTVKKGAPLTAEDINETIIRATELGWTGGSTVAQSIIHQIGDEFFGDLPDTEIEAQLTKPFATYPVGTKVRIVVG